MRPFLIRQIFNTRMRDFNSERMVTMPEIDGANARLGKERILSVTAQDVTKGFIENLFANHYDRTEKVMKPAPFKTTDPVQLTNREYQFVKEKSIDTTLGRIVANRFILERTGIIQHTGFYNVPLTKKGIGKLDSIVVELLVADIIDADTYAAYIDSRDMLGFWCTSFTSAAVSSNLLRPIPAVEKRKKELFKERAKELNSDNPVDQIMAMNEIEAELVGIVKQTLSSDPSFDIYLSGGYNLDNNYKNINVTRGAVFNQATKRYDIVENSYMNGIKKKDITAFSNNTLAGAYPSAVGTAEAGYMGKVMMALLQTEHLDSNMKSDCGTTVTIPFTVTKNNKKYILYRNLNVNGKTVMTTPQNVDQFAGKTVRMYSPQCCKHDAICAKCAGQVFHNLGVSNIGLLTSDITDKLLNLKLKSKHDLSQNAGAIKRNQIFLDDNKYFDVTEHGIFVNKATMKLFVPRVFEEIGGFVLENTCVDCMAVVPTKFYDKNGKEIFSTRMVIPAVLTFNVYNDIQQTPEEYIITYDPGSEVTCLNIQKTAVNTEFFIKQIYFYGSTPQLPYDFMTDAMFRCLEINDVDLNGPSISYELLARAVCRAGNKSFAQVFGQHPGVDPMSYTKVPFREAVQKSGILQGILFEDISTALNVGLAQTLNGVEPTPTPLEKIIRA